MKKKIVIFLMAICSVFCFAIGCESASGEIFAKRNEVETKNSIVEHLGAQALIDIEMPDENASLEEFIDYGEAYLNGCYEQIGVPYNKLLIKREIVKGKNKIYFAQDKQQILDVIDQTIRNVKFFIFNEEECARFLERYEAIAEWYYLGDLGDYALMVYGDQYPFMPNEFYVYNYLFNVTSGAIHLWDGEKLIPFDGHVLDIIDLTAEQVKEIYQEHWSISYEILVDRGIRMFASEKWYEIGTNNYLSTGVGSNCFMELVVPKFVDYVEGKGESPYLFLSIINKRPNGEIIDDTVEIGYVNGVGANVPLFETQLTEEIFKFPFGGYVEYNKDKTVNRIVSSKYHENYLDIKLPIDLFQKEGTIKFYCKIGNEYVYTSLLMYSQYYLGSSEIADCGYRISFETAFQKVDKL